MGWLADEHVADFVDKGFVAVLTTEGLQVGLYFLFVLGGSWNIHQLAKITPHGGGLEAVYCCVHGLMGIMGLAYNYLLCRGCADLHGIEARTQGQLPF